MSSINTLLNRTYTTLDRLGLPFDFEQEISCTDTIVICDEHGNELLRKCLTTRYRVPYIEAYAALRIFWFEYNREAGKAIPREDLDKHFRFKYCKDKEWYFMKLVYTPHQ